MAESREYRFHIDAFTPDTLPMARLSEYLADLSELLGNKEHVHFLRVEHAESSNLAYVVDLPAVPRTRRRLELVRTGNPAAPPEALKAYKDINSKLLEDGASAEIGTDSEPDNLITFPGKSPTDEDQSEVFGPIVEAGSIDGQVVRVGGFDKTIPVHIRTGKVPHYCTADENMARRLGPYVLGSPIRVFGEAKWYREREQWKRKVFTILEFTAIEDVSLVDSFARLRSIPGELHSLKNPLDTLDMIRHGPSGRKEHDDSI